jgi:hypothetical protein
MGKKKVDSAKGFKKVEKQTTMKQDEKTKQKKGERQRCLP